MPKFDCFHKYNQYAQCKELMKELGIDKPNVICDLFKERYRKCRDKK